jgi:hypothetical protein
MRGRRSDSGRCAGLSEPGILRPAEFRADNPQRSRRCRHAGDGPMAGFLAAALSWPRLRRLGHLAMTRSPRRCLWHDDPARRTGRSKGGVQSWTASPTSRTPRSISAASLCSSQGSPPKRAHGSSSTSKPPATRTCRPATLPAAKNVTCSPSFLASMRAAGSWYRGGCCMRTCSSTPRSPWNWCGPGSGRSSRSGRWPPATRGSGRMWRGSASAIRRGGTRTGAPRSRPSHRSRDRFSVGAMARLPCSSFISTSTRPLPGTLRRTQIVMPDHADADA